MLVSLNWLKKFTSITLEPGELVELIGSRLVEVESVTDLSAHYRDVVVVQIQEKHDHSNADKLAVYLVDVGESMPKIEKTENGLVQVVSGDKSLNVGDKVAWIPPGAVVPNSYNNKQVIKLESRNMRGEISHGMFGSGKELGLNNNGESVQVLDINVATGSLFAESYELNDVLIDIENKSLTHRPDCFGVVGFAREIAGIQGQRFGTPDWMVALDPVLGPIHESGKVEDPIISIDDPALCPRYQAVVIGGLDATRQSPLLIQSYLTRVGMRPVNMVVDITNYLMLVTGHPLHAFDYDSFLNIQGSNPGKAAHITIRGGRDGESLTLLDGRTIKPHASDILICAGQTPVALGGAMGGQSTEVSEKTTSIILESATFNLFNLRGTVMRHGIFSDAATRFTKGQPASQTAPVIASAVRMLCDIPKGFRVSNVVDSYPLPQARHKITLSADHSMAMLGASYTPDKIRETLENVECLVRVDDSKNLLVEPGYWRVDLAIPEDLIEEIGRLNGYDLIKTSFPVRPYVAQKENESDKFSELLRNFVSAMGANEVLTYNFVPARLLKKANQDIEQAFKITNSLSPELQHYRLSLTPSLLDKAYTNVKAREPEFVLYEINKVHHKSVVDRSDSNLPLEHRRLALIICANDKLSNSKYEGAPYYHAYKYLNELLSALGVEFKINNKISNHTPSLLENDLRAPYDSVRSGLIMNHNLLMGVVGEFSPTVTDNFKLPKWVSGFEIDIDQLYLTYQQSNQQYHPISKFQGTERDITIQVSKDYEFSDLQAVIVNDLEKLQSIQSKLIPLDIFSKNDKKNVTFRLELTDENKTITSEDANSIITTLGETLVTKCNAKII